MSSKQTGHAENHAKHYFVPENSKWPAICSVALFFFVSGLFLFFNGHSIGVLSFVIGLSILLYTMYGWWADVVVESESGKYKQWEDSSFRWAMGWFIFSEVMFFAGFFGMLFYARVSVIPELSVESNRLIWPDYESAWPTAGPYAGKENAFGTISALGIPAINTLLLLTSGATLTFAHWALKVGNRRNLIIGMLLTITLGLIFLSLQAYEYVHAYRDLNLRLDSGIYGSTFFMLTGFHGMHVTVGTIALIVITLRCMKGHFTGKNHFGFEAVAWYWHFVDVVWLLLFVIVYAL